MTKTIQDFTALLEQQQIARLKADNMACEANITNAKVKIRIGPKYTHVDIGSGSRYAVENATGNIFGTAGYGVVDRKHPYGTLDTIESFDWSAYVAKPVVGADFSNIDFHPLYGGRRKKVAPARVFSGHPSVRAGSSRV